MAVPLPTILVVDDNAAALKATTLILQKAGYRVAQAEDGAAALREVHALRPSLVLLDVMLPDISGLEVLRQIRADPALQGVSVVLLSSHQTAPEQQAGGLDGGADGYIARPIASAELLARVRSQLRLRDLAEKLRASELRYRRLFESAKDGILILDAGTGMVVDVNPFLVELLGFSHEDFLGKKVWELGFLKDIVASEANFTELQEKEYIRFENQPLESSDGRRIKAEFVSNVYLVNGKKVIQCNIRDITARMLAEQSLGESEERFRTMANSMPQLAWIARADGHITWYNRRWYEYTGTTLEQMEGWGWQSVHDPAVLPRVMEGWTGAIEAGKPFDMEFPLRGADGRCRIFLTRVEPSKDSEGRVVQWFGTNTDVETLKLVEAQSERRLSELEMILDSVPALIFYKDLDGRFVRVNRALAELVGVPPQDFIGKTDAEMGSPLAEQYRADDLRVMELGEPICQREEQILTPTGIRWLRTDKIPYRDGAGRIIGLICFAVDITERKRAEEALRQSGERLAGIVNSAMDAIISVDAGQRIVLFNGAAERMFGYSASEMTGQPLDRLLPARFRAGHARRVEGFAGSGVSTRKMGALGAISGVRANGEEFPIEASISQVQAAGETLCTVILRDITERQQTESKLRQSGEELRALASHLEMIREEQAARIARELHDEIGQMLTVLKLHLRSLQRQLTAHTGEATTLESREAEELIEGAVRSVRQLCTELRPPMLDHLGLRLALKALASDFRTRSGIEYTFSAPVDFPVLDTQRQTTVYRIVQELLTNVARHARASEVRLELRVQGADLEIEVTDNGRGIAPEDTAGKGSLGLLGMRERALAAGGRMTIAAHPDGGTTGRAHLPLAQPPAKS